jgi:hypothetical protein
LRVNIAKAADAKNFPAPALIKTLSFSIPQRVSCVDPWLVRLLLENSGDAALDAPFYGAAAIEVNKTLRSETL